MLNNHIKLTGFTDEIDADFEKQLSAARELGIPYIEIRGVSGKGIDACSLEEVKRIKEKLDAYDIKVSCIGSPIGKIQITADFAPHYEKFQHVVNIAKLLGTPYIRIFSFFIPQGEQPENYRHEVLERMKQLLDYAKEQNVILLHENEKDIYGDTAARCEELMNILSCQNFLAIFDFANFVQCGENTWEAFERMKPYIAYIHIKDALNANGSVVPAGQGDGNVKRILQVMKETGYQGFLSLEPHLIDFAGLKTLEQHVEARNSMLDGKMAFRVALNALKAILWDLNWR
jgi:sugar phosphate isomerase/epimerase